MNKYYIQMFEGKLFVEIMPLLNALDFAIDWMPKDKVLMDIGILTPFHYE